MPLSEQKYKYFVWLLELVQPDYFALSGIVLHCTTNQGGPKNSNFIWRRNKDIYHFINMLPLSSLHHA